MRHHAWWMASCVFFAGCALSEPAEEVGAANEALIGGAAIPDNPEVGQFWGPGGPCTGTLIKRRAILSAAHCFDRQSNSLGLNTGTFTFKNGTMTRTIHAFVSLTSDENNVLDDIAVAELDSDVDPVTDGVLWADVATLYPTDPTTQLRLYGHGCGDFFINQNGIPSCTESSDFSVKRALDISWSAMSDDGQLDSDELGTLTVTVSGDSGGPMMNSNYITYLVSNSNYALDDNGQAVSATHGFADTVRNWRRIDAALEDLGIND